MQVLWNWLRPHETSGSASAKLCGARARPTIGTARIPLYPEPLKERNQERNHIHDPSDFRRQQSLRGGAELWSTRTQEVPSSISSLLIHAASCDRTRCTTAQYCRKIQALLAHSMDCRQRFSPACVECTKLAELVARCGPVQSPSELQRELTESMGSRQQCALAGVSSRRRTARVTFPQEPPQLHRSFAELPVDHAGSTFVQAAGDKAAWTAGVEQGQMMTRVSPMSVSISEAAGPAAHTTPTTWHQLGLLSDHLPNATFV
jgi:hypothetical protein